MIGACGLGGYCEGSGWGEREEGDGDGEEDVDADEFAVFNDVKGGLGSHDGGVREAGPGGEGYETAVGPGVSDGEQEEDAKGDVEAEHHGDGGFGAEGHLKRVGEGEEEDSNEGEGDAKSQQTVHGCTSCVWIELEGVAVAAELDGGGEEDGGEGEAGPEAGGCEEVGWGDLHGHRAHGVGSGEV